MVFWFVVIRCKFSVAYFLLIRPLAAPARLIASMDITQYSWHILYQKFISWISMFSSLLYLPYGVSCWVLGIGSGRVERIYEDIRGRMVNRSIHVDFRLNKLPLVIQKSLNSWGYWLAC